MSNEPKNVNESPRSGRPTTTPPTAIRRERVKMTGVEFDKITPPQDDQQEILKALGIKL